MAWYDDVETSTVALVGISLIVGILLLVVLVQVTFYGTIDADTEEKLGYITTGTGDLRTPDEKLADAKAELDSFRYIKVPVIEPPKPGAAAPPTDPPKEPKTKTVLVVPISVAKKAILKEYEKKPAEQTSVPNNNTEKTRIAGTR